MSMNSLYHCPYGHEMSVDGDVLGRHIAFCMQCQESYRETPDGWIVMKLPDAKTHSGNDLPPIALFALHTDKAQRQIPETDPEPDAPTRDGDSTSGSEA